MRAKQSVIVKKSHPSVDNRSDAKRVARKYADRIYTARETSTSFRFRQKPPSDFQKGSFRTQKVNKNVSIIWGKLK